MNITLFAPSVQNGNNDNGIVYETHQLHQSVFIPNVGIFILHLSCHNDCVNTKVMKWGNKNIGKCSNSLFNILLKSFRIS